MLLFEPNGQGYYDFTDLLAVTCEKFVQEVEWQIEYLQSWSERFSGEKFEIILDLQKDYMPTVYFKRKNCLHIYKWYSKGNFETSRIARHDLEKIVGLFE